MKPGKPALGDVTKGGLPGKKTREELALTKKQWAAQVHPGVAVGNSHARATLKRARASPFSSASCASSTSWHYANSCTVTPDPPVIEVTFARIKFPRTPVTVRASPPVAVELSIVVYCVSESTIAV